MNQWIALIDMERGDLLEMAKKNSKIIKEAYGEYEVLTGDAEVKRLAEIRLMSHLEKEAALASARDKSTKEGLAQGRKLGYILLHNSLYFFHVWNLYFAFYSIIPIRSLHLKHYSIYS